ncbi:recombination mediator RecR [Nannocystis sp.]|uniref:recombination mediator RecR n=1 Tax=Nannocystis sp. TaxID=1962667 RepID=UPI002426AEC8|nr:recombination mediator RecR [Nannocystis sp.]MBK7824711.1 recombination protein RecR [Nannocystis sp.]MBK9753039.1 recombination protein RecR [Nannocystis sp.]
MNAGNDPQNPLQRLSALLTRLPGVGEKSALRLALALARSDGEYVRALAEAMVAVHDELRLCTTCCDLCTGEICERCRDPRRDKGLLCVVAQPQDRMAIERTGAYQGLYHVLHGVLDPLAGIGPAELKIDALLQRLHGDAVRELIVATSPNIEGDATALYLSKLLQPLGVRVTRIASGVAVGGELEYADLNTLHRALAERRSL